MLISFWLRTNCIWNNNIKWLNIISTKLIYFIYRKYITIISISRSMCIGSNYNIVFQCRNWIFLLWWKKNIHLIFHMHSKYLDQEKCWNPSCQIHYSIVYLDYCEIGAHGLLDMFCWKMSFYMSYKWSSFVCNQVTNFSAYDTQGFYYL